MGNVIIESIGLGDTIIVMPQGRISNNVVTLSNELILHLAKQIKGRVDYE